MGQIISVIIPAYNAQAWIARAVVSVCNQTYGNHEVIVVNDGSKDSTREIVESMMHDHKTIRLINSENRGVSHARNLGIEAARGEYISFLDADDELMPDALEAMKTCLEESGADICSTWRVTQFGNQLNGKKQLWDAKTGIKRVIEDHPATYAAWAKLYKREKLSSIRFPEGKRIHEDSYFVFRCLLSGMSMVVYNRNTYIYYLTENSASRESFSERMFDMIDLAQEKSCMIRAAYPEFDGEVDNILVKAHMALLRNLVKSVDNTYRSAEKESIRFVQQHRDSFIPAIKSDWKWFTIINNHLYSLYKFYYHVKRSVKYAK